MPIQSALPEPLPAGVYRVKTAGPWGRLCCFSRQFYEKPYGKSNSIGVMAAKAGIQEVKVEAGQSALDSPIKPGNDDKERVFRGRCRGLCRDRSHLVTFYEKIFDYDYGHDNRSADKDNEKIQNL